MSTVKLYVDDEGWKEFDLSNKEELKKRNIYISPYAQIGDDIRIGDGVWIGQHTQIEEGVQIEYGTRIGDRVWIGHGVWIGQHTRIEEGVQIEYGTRIGDEVRIGRHTRIGDRAWIRDGAWIKSLIFSGTRHLVSYWGEDRIDIGRKSLSIQGWIDSYSDIVINSDYTQEEIEEYRHYINIISEIHKKNIMQPGKIGERYEG
ncbi:transferase hexapeptide repeat protein [Leptospira noguchii]|uniref:transferase hexapeptide repeat protein n=1 Tax=Leptospira noguchii TaxID=28182 RepID=UPI00032872C6|nr:transferase hexapeptide repeat protein [Leptospira noguchii]EMS84075.1 transferase hexapeptide repeat protein [Leptospira noguchii str. Cascata]